MKFDRPTIVLFDMDGTTVRHINPRILGLLEWLDDVSFKISLWLQRRKRHPNYAQDQSRKPRLLVHRALHKIRRKPVEQIVQPCAGIYTLLTLIQNAGIPIGIVSNGLGKGYGHDILQKFALTPYYTAQIFREDIGQSKPHPDPLLRALKQIKDPVTAEDIIWYIGDRHKDILAALAAQAVLPAKVIPFAYGIQAAVAILEKGLSPDHIIVNYTDFAGRIYPLFEPESPHPQKAAA